MVAVQAKAPMRVLHVDLDNVYDPDPAQQARNLDQLVQRVVDWLIAYAAMSPADRVDYRKRRPATTRGERIEVLRRVRFNVRLHVATRALGISGRKVAEYLTAAGVPYTNRKDTR